MHTIAFERHMMAFLHKRNRKPEKMQELKARAAKKRLKKMKSMCVRGRENQ